jgi:GDP-4-dehydro-6-deoxy-D-mannose reductase
MKVLVTGAAGFVGRHMVAELLAAGHDVVPLVHGAADGLPSPVSCDITDAAALAGTVARVKPEGCVHLAGIAFVPKGWSEPNLVQTVNVVGTVNLLEAFRIHAPRARIVVASTSQVYGNPQHRTPLPEDAPMMPENPYAVSKMAADLTALLYAKRYGMHAVTARPANHIGPGQSTDFVVPAFASQIAAIAAGRHEPVMRVGNLESEREFTDVRDVASAYRLLLDKGKAGSAYNIATDRFVKIGDVLRKLCEQAGAQPRLETDPNLFRPTDTQARLETSRLRLETGWAPRYSLDDTLRDVLASCR